MGAVESIEQAVAEIEALRFRLWGELDEDNPAIVGSRLKQAYEQLDRAAVDLRFALTGEYPPRDPG
jgi:hypothetical protein